MIIYLLLYNLHDVPSIILEKCAETCIFEKMSIMKTKKLNSTLHSFFIMCNQLLLRCSKYEVFCKGFFLANVNPQNRKLQICSHLLKGSLTGFVSCAVSVSYYLVGDDMSKVSNSNTSQCCRPGVFIINFEHISQLYLLLTVTRQMPAG